MADNKKHLFNIFERRPGDRFIFRLQIGLSPTGRDLYVFEPRLQKAVHISLHRDGVAHVKSDGKAKRLPLFKSDWFANPPKDMMKQLIYFRPPPPSCGENCIVVNELPETPKTINYVINPFFVNPEDADNQLYKILIGAPSASQYHVQHHNDHNGNIDMFATDHWKLAVWPIALKPREDHDNGTFMWFFNTTKEILDSTLFKVPGPFEIGPASMKGKFIVSKALFDGEEVASVYYRL